MEVVNKEAAKAEYLARKMRGEPVRLKTLASELGITYRLLREWKTEGNWDSGLKGPHGPKMGNQNAKGHKNAKGCGVFFCAFIGIRCFKTGRRDAGFGSFAKVY